MSSRGFSPGKALGIRREELDGQTKRCRGVGAVGGLAIRIALGCWFAVGHAEGSADLKLGVDGFDGPECLTLSDVDDVGGAHAVNKIFCAQAHEVPYA